MDARQAWLITLHPSDFKTRAPVTTGPLYSEWKPPYSHTPAVKRTERMASSILKPLYRVREVSWQCVFVERRWRAASRSVRKAPSSGLWLLPIHEVCKWTLLEASRKKRFIQRSKSTFLKSHCYKIWFSCTANYAKAWLLHSHRGVLIWLCFGADRWDLLKMNSLCFEPTAHQGQSISVPAQHFPLLRQRNAALCANYHDVWLIWGLLAIFSAHLLLNLEKRKKGKMRCALSAPPPAGAGPGSKVRC